MINPLAVSTDAKHRTGMSIDRVAAALNLTRYEVMYTERTALRKLNRLLTHHGISLYDIIARDAGRDEAAPFRNVAAPEVDAS